MISDPSGRGPSGRRLLLAGLALCTVIATATTLLLLRYGGTFTAKVPVIAEMTSTGDGLPAGSDVKFRGLTVGRVQSSEVAATGETQRVAIDLNPEYADGVPSTVTARVAPANIFAVTSIELLDNGPGKSLTAGSVIPQDRSAKTVALQSALTTFRNVLTKLEPDKIGRILASLSTALDGSSRMPGSTLERLDHWLTAIDQVEIGADLNNFTTAAAGLSQSAPELLDVLGRSVTTARTLSERRDQLTALLTSAGNTVDTVNGLFARNPNTGKELVAGLADTFGALADQPDALPVAMANLGDALRKFSTTFHDNGAGGWKWQWSIDASLTPFQQYTRADCPRYGGLAGPSCGTAPETVDTGIPALSAIPAPELAPGGLPAIPGLPTLPGLPAVPGLPTGLLPGIQPAALRGPAGVAAMLGRNPTATELLVLNAAMAGGSVRPVAEGGSR
ncbi:MCE family protein [Nocardia sp. NBC_00511]|uniref:MCE family protein n=1 Tax=Nocardia sp. NBC_00511 TaxID=2903591 RepID=UPI0030E0CC64